MKTGQKDEKKKKKKKRLALDITIQNNGKRTETRHHLWRRMKAAPVGRVRGCGFALKPLEERLRSDNYNFLFIYYYRGKLRSVNQEEKQAWRSHSAADSDSIDLWTHNVSCNTKRDEPGQLTTVATSAKPMAEVSFAL